MTYFRPEASIVRLEHSGFSKLLIAGTATIITILVLQKFHRAVRGSDETMVVQVVTISSEGL
jgi:hypothetical protein